MKVQPPPEEEIDARYRANTMGSDVSDELQNTTGPSPVSQQVSEVVGEGVDWEMINIGQEDMKLFERMMEEKIEGLRSEIYSELEAAIRELSESFYTALQQTASSETVSATGTVRQNKKVVHALNRLSESMIVVQDELNLQKNLAKLAEMKAKEGKKRRSKLYYGNKDGGEMDHVTQRFFALRSILTFISCIPPAALVFGGAILIEDKRYYRLAVAFWPIEALFVLLHFIITIERSTREPNPEEKIHFVAHFVCHWVAIISYLVLNPGTTALWPVILLAFLTSTPMYYLLKQVRAAVQQYHVLKGNSGEYVDEVFILLLGVLVPQLYLWFETWSSYSGEDEGTSSHNGVGLNANLCISILLLILALFDIAVLGTGVSCVRDLMCFAIPPFLQASQLLIGIGALVALYFQGSKESEDDMSATKRQALWYVFATSSMLACIILAIKLPLKDIVAKRRRKLSVTGRTAREKAFDIGPEKNAGNSSLPKVLGVEVTPYERELSFQRKEHNKRIQKEAESRAARHAQNGSTRETSIRSANLHN